jgi:hypothetical protein
MLWMSSSLNFLVAFPLASLSFALFSLSFCCSYSFISVSSSCIPWNYRSLKEMRPLALAEDCEQEPLEGLASLKSTTPSNMANLQKSKD